MMDLDSDEVECSIVQGMKRCEPTPTIAKVYKFKVLIQSRFFF